MILHFLRSDIVGDLGLCVFRLSHNRNERRQRLIKNGKTKEMNNCVRKYTSLSEIPCRG